MITVTEPDAVLAARLAGRGESDIMARLACAVFSLPEGIKAETVLNDSTPEAGIASLPAALLPVSA